MQRAHKALIPPPPTPEGASTASSGSQVAGCEMLGTECRAQSTECWMRKDNDPERLSP